MSNYDFFGTNPDRNWEIYLWDGTGIPRALQVTFSTDNPNGRIGGATNAHPALSADGTQVFFRSSDNLTGENAAGHDEIFRARLCPAFRRFCRPLREGPARRRAFLLDRPQEAPICRPASRPATSTPPPWAIRTM